VFQQVDISQMQDLRNSVFHMKSYAGYMLHCFTTHTYKWVCTHTYLQIQKNVINSVAFKFFLVVLLNNWGMKILELLIFLATLKVGMHLDDSHWEAIVISHPCWQEL
jgi:hypothetical protein